MDDLICDVFNLPLFMCWVHVAGDGYAGLVSTTVAVMALPDRQLDDRWMIAASPALVFFFSFKEPSLSV